MQTKKLILYSLFTAFICIFSCIAIPVGAVPVSMGIAAVIIASLVLGACGGFVATLVYILIGSCGLPVFAGFSGGLQVLFGPTGGYIWSYLVIAFMTGISKRMFLKKNAGGRILGVLIVLVSLLICYVIGTLWFSFVQDIYFDAALAVCVYPFVVFDIIKVFVALYIAHILNKRISFRF